MARHGQAEPADDGHDYPWRAPFAQSHANTKESNLDQTSPVHMYPLGVTAGDVWDMAGNVWEWTSDVRENNSKFASLKGGSYYWEKDSAKASAADVYFRWHGFFDSGFRVVVVPISR